MLNLGNCIFDWCYSYIINIQGTMRKEIEVLDVEQNIYFFWSSGMCEGFLL